MPALLEMRRVKVEAMVVEEEQEDEEISDLKFLKVLIYSWNLSGAVSYKPSYTKP